MTAQSFDQALDGAKLCPTEALGRRQMDCPKHGAFFSAGTGLRNMNTGRMFKEIWQPCAGCKQDATRADAAALEATRQTVQRVELEAMLQRAALPLRFIGKTLDTFKAEGEPQCKAMAVARDFIDQFDTHARRGNSLIFLGKPGTGKSHLAAAILQGIMPRTGFYTTCMGLIQAVRDTWRKDSERSELQVLRALSATPLLVIDEVGVQYNTDGERTILTECLDARYRDMRPTVLLTNLDIEGLKVYLGDRIFDRMREIARLVPFDWSSYRATARKEQANAD